MTALGRKRTVAHDRLRPRAILKSREQRTYMKAVYLSGISALRNAS